MEKYYIFDLNKNVERKEVSYNNRYGLRIVGDLYISKNLNKKEKYPALIVGAPYGGV